MSPQWFVWPYSSSMITLSSFPSQTALGGSLWRARWRGSWRMRWPWPSVSLSSTTASWGGSRSRWPTPPSSWTCSTVSSAGCRPWQTKPTPKTTSSRLRGYVSVCVEKQIAHMGIEQTKEIYDLYFPYFLCVFTPFPISFAWSQNDSGT